MGKITFVIGGTRSGKSAYALKAAGNAVRKVAFIATCEPLDGEMNRRIILHKNSRPCHWKTFEEPQDPASVLKKIGSKFDCIVIDCLTLMVSNLMLKGLTQPGIESKVNKMLSILNKIKAQSIIVSNEVGLGIVPDNKSARDFRDMTGKVNQLVAGQSHEVFFLVSGIPWRIK